ncbi:MAG: DNA polymerase III subunit delta [Bacteroidetes bacterium]|nr:DNA polymerase III subunit delta [Bacteroidota bacterium]
MNESTLLRHISEKSFLPVYLLYGEEEFLIERAARMISDSALGDGDPSFNMDVYRGTEHEAEEITAAASAYPFMSEKRVVLVREADPILKKPALASYVRNPSPETVLLLCAGPLKPSRAKKTTGKGSAAQVLSFLQQQERSKQPMGAAVDFPALKDTSALRWIAAEVHRGGKDITPEACTVMQALRGNGTRVLASEIEKLRAAAPEKNPIDVDDIYMHLGASRQYNVFELSNAVMARDGAKAQEILSHLLRDEEPVAIVAVLARQFSLLWRVRSLDIRGRATDDQARDLGLFSAWQIESIRPYAKNFPDSDYFERCFEYILETDVAVKSQAADSAVAVTRLVSELTRS